MTAEKLARNDAKRDFDGSIFENAGVGIAILKAERIFDCNQMFAGMFGYQIEELTGSLVSQISLSVSSYEAESREASAEVESTGKHAIDLQCRRRDGTEIWINSMLTAFDRSDLSKGLIWIVHDIDLNKRSEQVLIESEDRFRRLTNLSSDWFWEQDENLRFTYLSGGVHAKGGLQPQNFIGKTRWEVSRGADTRDWAPHKALLNARQPFSDLEYQIRDEHGHVHWYNVSGEPWFDRQGVFKGYCGTSRDVTERKRMEALQAGQAHVLEMIATGASLDDVLSDLVRVIESQSDGMVGSVLLLGEDGQRICGGVAPSLPPGYIETVMGVSVAQPAGVSEDQNGEQDSLFANYHDLIAKYGFHSCWTTPIRPQLGNLLGAFGRHYRNAQALGVEEFLLSQIAVRIAGIAIERKRAEERIIHLARHDVLTGIYNRRAIMEILQNELTRHKRDFPQFSIILADLDHFKRTNDTYGHLAGDDVLREVARRIIFTLRPYDSFGRYGGEELLIVLPACDSKDAIEVAERVRMIIAAEKVNTSAGDIQTTLSMGVATADKESTNSVEELIQSADEALYRAKENGRNRIECVTR